MRGQGGRVREIVVTLGAGHGGHDIGTVSSGGIAEKDVTLYAARCVMKRLEAAGRFTVVLVRTGDFYMATPQRAQVARLVRSRCHVELHADLLAVSPKSTAVWFSADMPQDRQCAGALSRRMAEACGIPDGGARVRYDYCLLLGPPAGFEDYYTVIEALGAGGAHVFYCEFGIAGGSLPELRKAASRVAVAVAHAVCELFGVRFPRRVFPQEELHADSHPRPVFLRRGIFYIRAGPGPRHAVVRTAAGLIYTDGGEEQNGWMCMAGPDAGRDRPEFISLAAVDFCLRLPADGFSTDADGYAPAFTRRDGFALVLAEPRAGAPVLGAVGPGTCVYARGEGSFRRLRYGGRVGFAASGVFESG